MATLRYEQTAGAWDTAAPTYAEIMTLGNKVGITGLYAKDALDLTMGDTPVQGAKVLDVAAGSGSLSYQAAERVKSVGGSVLATDFSPVMIDILSKNAPKDAAPIDGQVMDGQNLTVADQSMNYAYSIFGVIFFEDQPKGLAELHRVLVDGGKVGVTSWSMATPMAGITMETMKRLVGPPPTTSAPPVIASMSDPAKFEAMLTTAGFKNVKVHEVRHDMVLTLEEFLAQGKGNPVIASLKSRLPEDKRDLFDITLGQVIRESYPSDPLVLNMLGYVGVGEK
eukprot:gene9100-10671_t